MDTKFFDTYRSLIDAGRKKEAKRAIAEFVRSFENLPEKRSWVRRYLPTSDFDRAGGIRHVRHIRHELYVGVVFPALLDGYRKQDPSSLLWLARTAANSISVPLSDKQIDFKSPLDLLKEAHALDKRSTDIQRTLLFCLVSGFEYSEHEWPTAILWGNNGATLEECEEIIDDLALARHLDAEGRFSKYFGSFEEKVRLYQSGRCLVVPESRTQG